MHARTERQSNIGWAIGGLALLGLPWWMPDLAIPICLGVAIGALALIVGRAQITEADGWSRVGLLLICAALGILGGGSWHITPIIALATLVILAGAALTNGRRSIGATDRLTGLLSPREFNARAEEELSRGLRFGRPVTLAIITVDNAVALRQEHGRRMADRALAHVAEALRGQSRSYDLLARLDDTRFAILLPETTREEALRVTDRIGAALISAPLFLPERPEPVILGVSMSLTEHPSEGATLQPLFALPPRAERSPRQNVLTALARCLVRSRSRRRRTTTAVKGDAAVLLFISAIWIVTLTLFVVTLAPLPRDLWASFALMLAIGIVSRSVGISLYGRGSISNHFVIIMAGSIFFGPSAAMILAVIIGFYNRPWDGLGRKSLFDSGSYALIAGLLSLLVLPLAQYFPAESWFHLPLIGQGLILGAVCYILNAGSLIIVIALTARLKPYTLWRQQFAWFIPYTLVFGILAVFMAQTGLVFGPVGLLIFAAPAFMILLATKQYVEQTKASVITINEARERLSTLNGQLSATVEELQGAYTATLEAFSGMLDARDSETEGHSQRVVRCAVAIGKEMHLTADELASLEVGALLHDIGKVGVSDHILRKNGPLTPEEWLEMRKHPEIGYELTSRISFLDHASPIVRHHHERWDGSGYPDGLCGENIPLAARIFAVADSFDAMISDRPYRRGMPLDQVHCELHRGAGKQFDPQVVAVFIVLLANEEWVKAIRAPHAGDTPLTSRITAQH